jgi:hypothetical protein
LARSYTGQPSGTWKRRPRYSTDLNPLGVLDTVGLGADDAGGTVDAAAAVVVVEEVDVVVGLSSRAETDGLLPPPHAPSASVATRPTAMRKSLEIIGGSWRGTEPRSFRAP